MSTVKKKTPIESAIDKEKKDGKNRQKTERVQNKNLKRDAGPGRPKGQRNYKTIYREALVKIAEANNTKLEDIEDSMVKKAVSKAIKGDFNFYRDIMDRLHGKPLQKQEISQTKPFIISHEVIDKYAINETPKGNSKGHS